MLAEITPEDDANFQKGYAEVSAWARRHDSSEESNLLAPTPDELQSELNRVTQCSTVEAAARTCTRTW